MTLSRTSLSHLRSCLSLARFTLSVCVSARTPLGARTPLRDCEPFRMASQGHVQTLTLAHARKVQGVMQMRQTRQMQIDEDACIRN